MKDLPEQRVLRLTSKVVVQFHVLHCGGALWSLSDLAIELLVASEVVLRGGGVRDFLRPQRLDRRSIASPSQAQRAANRRQLKARLTSVHSVRTLSSPRKLKRRKPSTDLMIPKAGSTVIARKA